MNCLASHDRRAEMADHPNTPLWGASRHAAHCPRQMVTARATGSTEGDGPALGDRCAAPGDAPVYTAEGLLRRSGDSMGIIRDMQRSHATQAHADQRAGAAV